LIFFFIPEMAYIRDSIERRLTGADLQVSDNDKPAAKDGKEAPDESRLSPQDSAVPEQKDSYLRSLRFMTGKKYTTAPFWQIFIRSAVILQKEPWYLRARIQTGSDVPSLNPWHCGLLWLRRHT
jgi:hypothetical protein